MDVGVVGINSRAAAASAKKLGLTVHLVDYFSDVDAEADYHHFLQKDPLHPNLDGEYSKDKLVELAIEKLSGKVTDIIPTSEVGCSPKLIKRLEKHFRILGNGSKQVRGAKDWKRLEKVLDGLGMRFPETKVASSLKEVKKAAEELGPRIVVKGNGMKAVLLDESSLKGFECETPEGGFLVQEYVSGKPVSCSVVCCEDVASAVSVNRQLIGLPEFGAEDFCYCGNIVPLGSECDDRIAEDSRKLAASLRLSGSVGVDYLLSGDEMIFMEVNTRLQDTFECVEAYRGVNMLEEHLQALEGEVRSYARELGCFGKGIIYAREDTVVGDLREYGSVGDVPTPGARILAGEPVCSIYAGGRQPDTVLSALKDAASRISSGF